MQNKNQNQNQNQNQKRAFGAICRGDHRSPVVDAPISFGNMIASFGFMVRSFVLVLTVIALTSAVFAQDGVPIVEAQAGQPVVADTSAVAEKSSSDVAEKTIAEKSSDKPVAETAENSTDEKSSDEVSSDEASGSAEKSSDEDDEFQIAESTDSDEDASADGDSDAPDGRGVAPLPPLRLGGSNKLDGIAAVVGDEIILVSEVEAYVYMQLAQLGMKPEDADMKKIVSMCMEDLIVNKVMVVRAKEDTLINVRNDEVESMLNNHINNLLRQNRLTSEQLDMQLRLTQGTSLVRFKNEARRAIREQLLKQKLQQSFFFSTRSVSRRDVEQFYAQYADSLPEVGESYELLKFSLRVAASDSVRQAAFDRITHVKRLLDGGASFDSLARQYSDGPEASSGGELGYLEKGSTTELALEERAFALPVGRVSMPFETRLGYHIILVEEKRDRRVKLRQIMVRHAPTDAERSAVVAKLDSMSKSIKTRAEFEAVAREKSADAVTRPRGGSMGWVGLLEMPSALRSAVQDLEDGHISAPIAEDNVVSIYMVARRVDNRRLTLENDYLIIAEKTKEIMAQKRLLDAVQSWREKMFVDIRI